MRFENRSYTIAVYFNKNGYGFIPVLLSNYQLGLYEIDDELNFLVLVG